MKLLRAMGVVGGIKILAKISAVFRDRAIALTLGTGTGGDMFFLGFNVTGGVRGVFAEEPLKAAFLPLYAECSENDRQNAWTLVNTVFNTVLVGLGALALVWVAVIPPVVRAVGHGTADPALLKIAAATARMLAVTIIFGGLATVSVSVLTVAGRFAVPAALPLIMNIIIIFSALFLYPHLGVTAIVLGVVVGSILQVAVLVPPLYRSGYRYRPVMDFSHPLLKQLLPLFLPVMCMQGLVQVNIVVDTAFAAALDTGSISYLYYGNRVMLFPYDIIAMAVTMVAFPALAKSAAHHDANRLNGVLDTALGMVVFFSLPAALGGMVLARPIIGMLFGSVMDGSVAVNGTARALAFYLAGMPAFIAVRVLYPVFYSLKDTRTPLGVGVVCLGLNVIFDYMLVGPLGYAGLALSSALAAGVNIIVLIVLLRRKRVIPAWHSLAADGMRSAGGAILTAAGVWWVSHVMLARYGMTVQAAGAVGIGIILYPLLMRLFGSRQMQYILAAVRGDS